MKLGPFLPFAQILFVSAIALGQRQQQPQPGKSEPPLTPLAQLVELTARDGVLELSWADGVPHQARRISAQGTESRWIVEPFVRSGDSSGVLISRGSIGTKRADQFTQISASSGSGAVGLSGSRAIEPAFVMLSQGPGRQVRLIVRGGTVGEKHLVAENLLVLRTQESALVREYLLPIFEQITGEADLLLPGGSDVYRVFDEITSDEQTDARVAELIPQLSAASAADRQRASAELEALCPRAICSLLRIDLSMQPPEGTQRVKTLVSRHQRRTIDEPSKMREDLPFLIDCLEFPDFRVRAAARTRIEQLRGAAIVLPAVPKPADWSRAADELRQKLSQPAAR